MPLPDPAPPSRRLAAVVLNFRTPAMTVEAVVNLRRSERPIDEIVVVDNDAEGSCQAPLAAAGESATYIANGANLGFAGGMNRGIRHALDNGATLVLLVNSDAFPEPDCVGRLEQALTERPDAGIAAPVLLMRSDPTRVASAGFRFSPRSGRARQVGYDRPLAELAPPAWQPHAAVSGCVMLLTRELCEQAGLFEESFFFSFEDLELCLRARRAGFEVGLVGDARVLHAGSASIPLDSPARFYYAARNHLLAASRGAPLTNPLVRWARAVGIVGLNLAHALRFRGPGRLARLAAVARGTLDAARGRYGAAGFAPREAAAITSR